MRREVVDDSLELAWEEIVVRIECAEDVAGDEVVRAAAVEAPGEVHAGPLFVRDLVLVLRPERAVPDHDQSRISGRSMPCVRT